MLDIYRAEQILVDGRAAPSLFERLVDQITSLARRLAGRGRRDNWPC